MALEQEDLIRVLRHHLLHRDADRIELLDLFGADEGFAKAEVDIIEVDGGHQLAHVFLLHHLLVAVGLLHRRKRRRRQLAVDHLFLRIFRGRDVGLRDEDDPRLDVDHPVAIPAVPAVAVAPAALALIPQVAAEITAIVFEQCDQAATLSRR